MSGVTIQQVKADLPQQILEVSADKEVVRESTPVARLVPIGETKGERKPGSLKRKLLIGPLFFEPMSADELAEWE